MVKLKMTQHIEDRLKAQVKVWHLQSVKKENDKDDSLDFPFITISREFGCVAYTLAEKLAEKLNAGGPKHTWEVFDKRLLDAIIENEKISADLIESLSKKTRSEIEDYAFQIFAGNPSELTVYKRLTRTMRAIAGKGYAIIIGRGGSMITKDIPNGVHIRLIAPLDWRVNYLKQFPERAAEADRKTVEIEDKNREQFLQKYLKLDIKDPLHYHMVLNCGLMSTEQQLEAIMSMVKQY